MKKLLSCISAIFICTFAVAETININWKVNGTNYAQSTCQTGSNLILPATAPTKYGYVFRGWELNSLITGTVKTGSKNLFDVTNSRVARNGTLQSDGSYYIATPSTIGMWTPSNRVAFNGKENTQYTISAWLKTTDLSNDTNISIGWVYSDGTYGAGVPRGAFADYTKIQITSDVGKTVVGFGVMYNGNTKEDVYLKNIQIEEGTTATAYEEYNEMGVPSPTNPVEPEFYTVGNIVLRALGTGDSAIADTYDLKTGKITRRVGVAVFKGTENWTKYSGNNWTFLYPLAGLYDFNKLSYVLSTHFQKMAGWNSKSGIYLGNNMTNGIHIGADGLFSDINSFKQWLAEQYNAGTPLTVYYPLATPTEENPN